MAYENREGQGSLFKNDRATSDRSPKYKGKIFVGGRWYWLSAWLRQSQKGETYMSLQADPMEQQAAPAPAPQGAPVQQRPHQATGLSLAELSGELREQDPDLPF